MKIEGKLVDAIFVERLNKFECLIEIDSNIEMCSIPNPGRLEGLLNLGTKVILKKRENKNEKKKRKNKYDLLFIFQRDKLISVNSHYANKIFLEGFNKKIFEELKDYISIIPEYTFNESRIDFLLINKDNNKCLVECKSCTDVVDSIALFPNAPTQRGRRHLNELIKAKNNGYRTCIFFIVQREDAKKFKTNDIIDPEFGKIFKIAINEGVECYAYSCKINIDNISIKNKLKIIG